jgi:multiple antibiotic resistance protein
MNSGLHIFLLALAAIFPIVNPPGSALVFLGLTSSATHEVRHLVAWRVARNAFFVLVSALLLGSLILSLYGISIPVLRVAGGLIVAVAVGSSSARAAKRNWKRPPTATTTKPIHSIWLSIR